MRDTSAETYRPAVRVSGGLIALLLLTLVSGGPIAAQDPVPLDRDDAAEIPFRESLLGVHPRLLYTPTDVERFRSPAYQREIGWILEAGRDYAGSARGGHPTTGEPWNRGDGWQRYCWWRGVTAAQYYAFTGDERYADDEIDFLMAVCASEHWERGGEQDYGMGTANIMGCVAIMYDTLHEHLTEAQRTTVQRRLWLAADRFYHYGWTTERTLPNAGVRYWQADPQNNHRWHRLCGYLLGCLAIYGEVPEINGYLAHAIEEARFILEWLPEDGSCHESVGYTSYGASFLVPAFAALHRCIEDTDEFVRHPYLHNAPYWRAHNVMPGGQQVWAWGDGGWGPYYFAHYNFGAIKMTQDATAQALHRQLFDQHPGSYAYHGFTLTHYDVDLAPGNVSDAAPYRFFDDMGMATWRTNWTDDDAAAAMFKCSVYGGERLNEFRDAGRRPRYVNVAHDHPDANSFQFAWGGEIFAMEQAVGKAAKMTRQHNTLLVNGTGQAGEATQSDRTSWTQPIANMGSRADVTEWFGAPGYGVCIGEAGGFYDDLATFERTLIFVDGLYIVAVDRVVANGRDRVDLDWMFHCNGAWSDLGENTWEIEKNDRRVRYTALSNAEVAATTTEADGMTSLRLRESQTNATMFVQVLLPQTDRREAATVRNWEIDGEQVYLEIERPGAVDRIAVGGWRGRELRTDATVAVATLPTSRRESPRLMWVNGRSVDAGVDGAEASSSVEVNACLTGDGLWAAMPLAAERVRPVRFSLPDDREIESFNGTPVDDADELLGRADVPHWQPYLGVRYGEDARAEGE